MSEETETGDGSSSGINRRTVLSLGVGTAVAATGLAAFTGIAAAWERFDADFRGCSEVWLIVSEEDLDFGPPLTANVVVATDGGTECRTVTIEEESATTIPGQYGDTPIVKYQVSGGEKILGVIGNSPSGNPLVSETVKNEHRCTKTPNTRRSKTRPATRTGNSERAASIAGQSGPRRSRSR
jgi:hypothetical protein